MITMLIYVYIMCFLSVSLFFTYTKGEDMRKCPIEIRSPMDVIRCRDWRINKENNCPGDNYRITLHEYSGHTLDFARRDLDDSPLEKVVATNQQVLTRIVTENEGIKLVLETPKEIIQLLNCGEVNIREILSRAREGILLKGGNTHHIYLHKVR